MHIQIPHSFLSSQPPFHVPYTCQAMFVHAQSPTEGLFSTRLAEFALYHLLQIFKRIHASQDSKEGGCRNPGLSACQLAKKPGRVIHLGNSSAKYIIFNELHFQRRKCSIRIFPFSSYVKIHNNSLICNKSLNKKCRASRAVCLKGCVKDLDKHHQR